MYVGCFDVGIPRRLLRGQVAETLRERGDSKMINPLVAQYPNPISTQKYRSEQIGKRREWVSGIGITGKEAQVGRELELGDRYQGNTWNHRVSLV